MAGVVQNIREFLKNDLSQLERLKIDLFREEAKLISPLLNLSSLTQGKQLRPLILFLCARLEGDVRPIHHPLALVVECIHTATLIHDDILDEALLRRLDGTFNAKWGNERAVLFGDYILAVAFYLSSTLKAPEAFDIIIEATKKTCLGELMQLNEKFNFMLSPDQYLRMIDYKTAQLFSAACQLGYLYSQEGHFDKHLRDKNSAFQSILRFGTSFGILYQMMDDAIDLFGEEEAVGKSLGTDLVKGKMTLPILLLLKEATVTDRETLIKILTDSVQKIDVIKAMLTTYRTKQKVLDYLLEYAKSAKSYLSPFLESEAKTWLLRLTDDVVCL